MFNWLTKVIEKEVVKTVEKEKIVVVGDNVVDVYVANIPRPEPPSSYIARYDPDRFIRDKEKWEEELQEWSKHNPKYFTDPVEAFKYSEGNSVSDMKAIKCSDGNCYLLEAIAVITIQGDAIEE